jgi:phosphoribosyl 1,2-cyclic phosphodiesterase
MGTRFSNDDDPGYIVTFFGVRGSTPCHGESIVRYGGNTSCVAVSVPGHDPFLFDLGTGLRYFGYTCDGVHPFRGTCLLSHLHWDHIQGLPFFTPLLREGAILDVYAPIQESGQPVGEAFAEAIRPPLFPVPLAHLPGTMRFHDVLDAEFSVGDVHVMSRSIPHSGVTVGYRMTWRGSSVAYLSDHQMPIDGSYSVTAGALDLCRGADLVIHDAQYTPAEFAQRRDWGHCTVEYAVWVAATAGARRLALFHHDPAHADDQLDALAATAVACGVRAGVEVFAAREGMTVPVAAPAVAPAAPTPAPTPTAAS